MAVDPIEEWLGTRLKAAYPVDDWVLEGVTSALLLLEDRADAIDTIANFLGVADAPGTNEQIVDELFRRKRRDTAGAGAGGAKSHASEPVPSSAGPSRDASSRARARDVVVRRGRNACRRRRKDTFDYKTKRRRRRRTRRRLRKDDASPPLATRGVGEAGHQLPELR